MGTGDGLRGSTQEAASDHPRVADKECSLYVRGVGVLSLDGASPWDSSYMHISKRSNVTL